MLRNYLRTALRTLIRTRLYSFINVLGLSIGMAAGMLILQHVRYEKSYDGYHPANRRIYRLRYERTSEDGSSVRFASCCPPAADALTCGRR